MVLIGSATTMAIHTNPAMSRSSAVRGDQYDIIPVTNEQALRKVFAGDTIMSDEHEPACVASIPHEEHLTLWSIAPGRRFRPTLSRLGRARRLAKVWSPDDG